MLRTKLSSTTPSPAPSIVKSTSGLLHGTHVLLASRPRVSDVFKEAQRPIAAALRIHDHERRYSVIRSEVARFAVQRIHADGSIAKSISSKKSSSLRLSSPEINAKMLAMLSCCRVAGDWKASFALTQSVKESFLVPLQEPWLQLCIASIPAAQGLIRLQESGSIKAVNAYLDSLPPSEKLELREGFSHFAKLFGGLPANLLFTQSLPLFDESLRLPSGGSDTNHLVSLEDGGSHNSLALSSTSENALLATQNGRMISSAPKVVNPSFVTYLKAQGLTKSDAETASLVAALTGGTSSHVTSLTRSNATGGVGVGGSPANSSLVTTYHREVTFRINTHRSEWKAIRELLRHMQPFILPMNWYPDEVLWRVTLSDADAVAASLLSGNNNGGTTRITNNAGISNTTDAKQAETAISYVRHTLKALADSRLINYQSVASLLPALMLYPTVVSGMKRISHAEHNKVMGRDSMSNNQSPTLKFLDLCAAPGGKTGQLMDLIKDVAGRNVSMSNQKGSTISLPDVMSKVLVIANDADERRLRFMRGRLQNVSASMGFTHFGAEEFPISKGGDSNTMSPVAADGHQNSNHQHRRGVSDGFDGVLVDVPCSGEGRLQRDTKGWSSWHPQQGVDFHAIQVKALRRAIAAAKIGGVVVYSTCTLNPLENEAVVSTMLSEGLVDLVPIIHWGNTNNPHNSVIEFGEGASSLLKGQIPSELRPFLEPGLGTWKLPMSNGQYYNTSGTKHRHPHGISPSLMPPASPAVQQLLSDHCVRVVPHREWGSAGDAGLRRDERVLRGGVEAAYVGMSTEAFFLCKMVVKRHPDTALHDGKAGGGTSTNNSPSSDRPDHRSEEIDDQDGRQHTHSSSHLKNSDSRGGFHFVNAPFYRPVKEMQPGEMVSLSNNNQMFDLFQELSTRLLGNSDAVMDAVHGGVASKSLISRRDQSTKVMDVYSASTPLLEFLNGSYSTMTSLGPNNGEGSGGALTTSYHGNGGHRHRHTTSKQLNESLRRQLLSFGQHLLCVRPPPQLTLGTVAPVSSVSNVLLTQAGASYFSSLLGLSPPLSSSSSSNQVLDVPGEVVHRLINAAGRRHMQHTDISVSKEFKAAGGGGNSFSFMEVLGNKACTSGWGADDQLQLKVEPTWGRSSQSQEDHNDEASASLLDGFALSLPPGSLLVSESSFTDPFWHMKHHGRSGRRGSTQEERDAERSVVAEAEKRRHPVHSRWVKRLITDSNTLLKSTATNKSYPNQQQLKEGPVIIRSRLIPAHVKGSDAGLLSSGAEVILPGYVSLIRLSTNFMASKGPISNDSIIFAAVLTLTMSEEELQALKTLLPRYASATTFGATLQLPPPGSDVDGSSSQVRGLLSGTPAALPSMFKLDGGGRGRDSFNYTPNTQNIDENTFLLRSSSPNSTASFGRSQALPYQRHIERLASRSAQSEIETTTFTGDLIRQGNVGGVGRGREAANEFLEDGELGAPSRGVHGFGGSTITTAGFEGDGAAIEATETAATESGTNSGTGEYDMDRQHKPVLTVEAPTSGVVPQLEGSGDVIDGRYDQQLKRDHTSKLLDAAQAAEIRDAATRMIPEADMASNHRSWAKLGSAASSHHARRQNNQQHQQKQHQHHNLLKGTLPQSATQLVFGDDE